MIAQLGIPFLTVLKGIGVVQLLLGAAITGLALLGYWRNESRAMLLLGVGIASLTFVPVLFRLAFQAALGLQETSVIVLSLETVGLGLILSSIVVARRA